jgi:hypothetical protein|tara:strand:- start:81 stop:767 length:687 start_codon:yes stop_codon:yes gene_type:complete
MIDINKLKEHLERIESYNKELGVFLKLKSSELDFFFKRSKEWREGYLDNESFIKDIKEDLKRRGFSSKHENVLIDFGINGYLGNIQIEIEENLFQEDLLSKDRSIQKKYFLKSVTESLPNGTISNLRDDDYQMYLLTKFLLILAATKVCMLSLEKSTFDETPVDLITNWCRIWNNSSVPPFDDSDFKENKSPLQGFYKRDNKKWRINILKFAQFSIESNINTIKLEIN